MNYKARLTVLFVGLFFIVLTSILSFVYISYAEFRREEFFERLREKSFNTARLLAHVKEIDVGILRVIDQNSINQMYDEKILIFDEGNDLIYSSLDDETIPYSTKIIDQIRQREDRYYVDDDGDEVVGIHYTDQGKDYVVLASAYDRYGIIKLKNLRNLVILALILGTLLIAVSSYFYIRQVFRPIDELNLSIQNITENNLKEFIAIKKNRDELDKLAINYNEMLARLFKAFESQRFFVRNAAHELKTPLAVIQGKVEKLDELTENASPEIKQLVHSLSSDTEDQAVLIESLLLIQRLQSQLPIEISVVRIDELLDEAVREANFVHINQKIKIDIDSSIQEENQLTARINPLLLKICFRNLLQNAAIHAPGKELNIKFSQQKQFLQLQFVNAGNNRIPDNLVFEPFFRHPHEQQKPGHGLGLSIVKQVVELMKGSVRYVYRKRNHIFTIRLPLA